MSFIKTADGMLAPLGEPVKAYQSLGAGEEIVFDVKNQRNPKYHRLFFSWLGAVLANQDKYETIDQLRLNLMLATGRVKEVVSKTVNGWFTCERCQHKQKVNITQTAFVPESIAYEYMDESEFHEVQQDFDKVLMSEGINVPIGEH